MAGMNRLKPRLELATQSIREEGLGFLTLFPRVARTVPGWLEPRDARLLYALAHHGPGEGAIVEIGSAWGLSTIFLAAGARAGGRGRIIAIDPHTGDPWYLDSTEGVWPPSGGLRRLAAVGAPRPAYLPDRPGTGFTSLDGLRANLRRFGLERYVDVVVQTSNDAAKTLAPEPIRLLYIDGLHTYEGVHDDITTWVPRVVPGGVIVFDDYFNTNSGVGVHQAVDELLASGQVSELHASYLLTWVTKC
jgi:predicted O-methyltransferase YrrM